MVRVYVIFHASAYGIKLWLKFADYDDVIVREVRLSLASYSGWTEAGYFLFDTAIKLWLSQVFFLR